MTTAQKLEAITARIADKWCVTLDCVLYDLRVFERYGVRYELPNIRQGLAWHARHDPEAIDRVYDLLFPRSPMRKVIDWLYNLLFPSQQ